MFELVERLAPNAVIKVIGVGGGGGNAVGHMVNSHVDGVDFICANTDDTQRVIGERQVRLNLRRRPPTRGPGARHANAVWRR